jgi:hypothetical protein
MNEDNTQNRAQQVENEGQKAFGDHWATAIAGVQNRMQSGELSAAQLQAWLERPGASSELFAFGMDGVRRMADTNREADQLLRKWRDDQPDRRRWRDQNGR